MSIIFFSTVGGGGEGGEGKCWEVAVRVHGPALLIFTLFQSNIYKVNVREYPRDLCRQNEHHHNSMMAWHEVLTHVKRRQQLNEDVFEAGVLPIFIVSFKRFYDEYLLGLFFTIYWSLNVLLIFSLPNRNCKSLCLWLECVCVRPLNKNVSEGTISTFYRCHFQKMAEWDKVAFKFSLLFMLRIKSFKMWRRVMSFFMLLRFLLCVWKVIPYRKGISWGMCSL